MGKGTTQGNVTPDTRWEQLALSLIDLLHDCDEDDPLVRVITAPAGRTGFIDRLRNVDWNQLEQRSGVPRSQEAESWLTVIAFLLDKTKVFQVVWNHVRQKRAAGLVWSCEYRRWISAEEEKLVKEAAAGDHSQAPGTKEEDALAEKRP